MTYYATDKVRAPHSSWWRSKRPYVMHASFNGKFVAITIRIPGSAWVCHPSLDGDTWWHPKRTNPPRWVRKAAKMALREWLT